MVNNLFRGIIISLLMLSSNSFSASISGEITFLKKPPYAGIIYIEYGAASVSTPAQIDQKNKKFTKRVVAASKGQTVTFNNSDSIDHNIFANDRKAGVNFDIGLMPSGGSSQINIKWDTLGLVRIGCKIHPKMRAYIANIPSDHYSTFDFRNMTPPFKFEFKSLPDNAKNIILHLPSYDPITIPISDALEASTPITKKGKEKGSLFVKVAN